MTEVSIFHGSIRRHLTLGLVASFVLIGAVGGWAATSELSGAVIAAGQLVVESSVKKVQHPTGGVVGELRVREGDSVKAGDVVVRFDDTQVRANLAIVTKALDELDARQARNEAERDGGNSLVFPADMVRRTADTEVARLIAGEQRLFETRRASREGQRSQLREQVSQLREQIQGLIEQIRAKDNEIRWVREELKGVHDLWSKNLVQFTRVTALERDGSRIEGDRGALTASLAQSKARISETELKILQIDEDMRTEVGKELADIRGKRSELVERRVSAEDQLKRIDIRAPQDGIVHQLAVHTVGGVVTPSEPMMLVVPKSDQLIVEARIQPQDIDQLYVGQKALLRFSAFNQRTTPELNGSVSMLSADVSQDPKTGLSFFIVRLSVSPAEIDRLQGLKLLAGMPVETFIQTVPRTMLSYMVRPFSDQMSRAFREK